MTLCCVHLGERRLHSFPSLSFHTSEVGVWGRGVSQPLRPGWLALYPLPPTAPPKGSALLPTSPTTLISPVVSGAGCGKTCKTTFMAFCWSPVAACRLPPCLGLGRQVSQGKWALCGGLSPSIPVEHCVLQAAGNELKNLALEIKENCPHEEQGFPAASKVPDTQGPRIDFCALGSQSLSFIVCKVRDTELEYLGCELQYLRPLPRSEGFLVVSPSSSMPASLLAGSILQCFWVTFSDLGANGSRGCRGRGLLCSWADVSQWRT